MINIDYFHNIYAMANLLLLLIARGDIINLQPIALHAMGTKAFKEEEL